MSTLRLSPVAYLVFENGQLEIRQPWFGVHLIVSDPRFVDILQLLLKPRTEEEIASLGLTINQIHHLVSIGFLVDDAEWDAWKAWEEYAWVQASPWLLFGDTSHLLESKFWGSVGVDLDDERKHIIKAYLSDSPRPLLDLPPLASTIDLDDVPKVDLSRESLWKRETCRRFVSDRVNLQAFLMIAKQLLSIARQMISPRIPEQSDANVDTLTSFWSSCFVIAEVSHQHGECAYLLNFQDLQLGLLQRSRVDWDTASAIAGSQAWFADASVRFYICMQWDRHLWLYRHSGGLFSALVQIGEAGQWLMHSAEEVGFKSCSTAAVHESLAREALMLPPHQDVLYLVGVDLPR